MELREELQHTLGSTYTLERELQRGGMARVFVATDTRLRRRVVVKVLAPELAADVNSERFQREIQLAASLQHANIVPVLSAGDMDGVPYYAMPYVEGESLRAALNKGGLSITETVSILRDVARALGYAHARGIVHRDIKPDNVLLSHGAAVVTDFGVAKALSVARATGGESTLTQAGMAIGTPAYMAPEQAVGDPNIDQRADIYAFGCMAYELLSGTHPFAHVRSAHGLIRAHIVDEPLPLQSVRGSVPSPLADLVMCCLAKDPSERPATARDILNILDSVGGEVTRAGPAPAAVALPPSPQDRSVGVIPFVNLSAGSETDYFSDGITEDIINTLAHVPGLRVASRTSSFIFKGKTANVAEIGAALQVATVLEGSVRRQGNRLRITARLVNAANGFPMWSERFDRDLEDVFAIQDEVSRAIADQLALQLAGKVRGSRAHTVNAEAYDLYLRGRYFWSRRGAHLRTAIDYFTRASSLDPHFAAPLAGLADCHVLLASYGFASATETAEPARTAAYRALSLDDASAESHYAVGLYEAYFSWRLELAERHLLAATRINPSSAFPLAHLSHLLVSLGRTDEAYGCAEHACAIDPVSPLINGIAALGFICGHFAERARRVAERAVELDESFALGQFCLGLSRQVDGRLTDAEVAFERAAANSARSPLILSQLGALYARSGRRSEALQIVEELGTRNCDAHFGAFVLWDLGEENRALDALELAASSRAANLYAVATLFGRSLLVDVRWHDLLRRHGLTSVAEGHAQLARRLPG
ncbi:MAG TPA: protein kinase [Gemmatimonadaceae bacterium]|nr:protein kinase [Gemmatimonadaceae bacterium]